MAARSSVTSSGKIDFADNVKRLLKLRVMVGIPADGADRQPEPGEKGTPPVNATIGYIQEFGDDEKNIPARPFLVPGVASIKGEIVEQLRKAGEDAFDRDFSRVQARFAKVGTEAVAAVQQRITDGPFRSAPKSFGYRNARRPRRARSHARRSRRIPARRYSSLDGTASQRRL